MAVSVCGVCGVNVPEQSAWPAKKLLGSQCFIALLLMLLVSGPNIAWQISLAGHLRNNDIDQEALDAISANSSLINSIPGLKEVNITHWQQGFLSASSSANKDQYTAFLIGSSVLLVILPFVCFCCARSSIERKSTFGMGCICCVEGLCGWASCLVWVLPLALGATICLHLQSDNTFLDCAKIVPWVQKTVTDHIVGVVSDQQPPKAISAATLTLAIQPTLSLTLKELFQAANMTAAVQTPYLDAISTFVTTAEVNKLTVDWVARFKAQHPGSLPAEKFPLADATTDFLGFMFNETAVPQKNYCDSAVKKIYGSVGIVGVVLVGMAVAAFCKVFACCLGSCEAWSARNSFQLSALNVVGNAQKVYDEPEGEGLLATQPNDAGPEAPIGSPGAPPAGKPGFFAWCGNCMRKK